MPKISQLPADTSILRTDVITTVKASGSNKNKKVELTTLANSLLTLTGEVPSSIRSWLSDSLTGGNYISVGWGTDSVPVTDRHSGFYVEKFTATNDGVGTLDQGVGTFKVIKKSGANWVGSLKADLVRDAGTGDCVALTGVCGSDTALTLPGSMYGVWGIGYNKVAGPFGCYTQGCEFNVKDESSDAGHWDVLGSNPNSVGTMSVWANQMAGGYNTTVGIGVTAPGNVPYIAYNGTTATPRWHTGILVNKDSIVPIDATGKNEAIYILGSTTETDRSTAVRLDSGWFEAGLNFSNANFEYGAAIVLAQSHKIYWVDTAQIGVHPLSTTVNCFLARQDDHIYWYDGVAIRQLDFIPVVDARINDAINEGTWDSTTAGVLDAIRDALVTWGLITPT